MGTRIRLGLVAATLVGGLAACSSSNDVGVPDIMTIQAGNNQTGTVGAALPDTLQVLVVNQSSNSPAPFAGVTVDWTVANGDGSVNPATSVTDANGIASTVWTLGPTAGQQSVTATIPSSTQTAPETFTATADSSTTTTQ